MNEVVDKHLGRLMKALALDRVYGVVESYRGVFDEGVDAIPEIKSQLLKLDLAKPRKQIVRTLTWLLALLHDIDEEESRGIANDLLNRAVCHPVYSARIRSITRFTVDNFDEYQSGGVPVFQAKSLVPATKIKNLISSWLLEIPSSDRKGIVRLYVVPKEDQHFAGSYFRVLSKIVLVWQPHSLPRRPWWFAALTNEITLYHEFGHHLQRDRNLKVADAEKGAREYALDIASKAHPTLDRWIPGLFSVMAGIERDSGDVIESEIT
jgi:hypothetical protein